MGDRFMFPKTQSEIDKDKYKETKLEEYKKFTLLVLKLTITFITVSIPFIANLKITPFLFCLLISFYTFLTLSLSLGMLVQYNLSHRSSRKLKRLDQWHNQSKGISQKTISEQSQIERYAYIFQLVFFFLAFIPLFLMILTFFNNKM